MSDWTIGVLVLCRRLTEFLFDCALVLQLLQPGQRMISEHNPIRFDVEMCIVASESVAKSMML